jgi:HlyD family secretion protein
MKSVFRRVLVALGAVAILAGLVYAFWPKPVEVDVAQVRRGLLRVTVDDDGMTRIKERYVISAPLAGRLLRVRPRPGDSVKARSLPGDYEAIPAEKTASSTYTVLAIIEPTDPALLDDRARAEAEARVKVARAAVDRADAELEQTREDNEYATSELERVRRLVAGPTRSLSREEYDQARHRVRMAALALKSSLFAKRVADYELEQARAALMHTRPEGSVNSSPGSAPLDPGNLRFPLLSPIDGKVLRVFQESSRIVTPGTPVLEVGDPTDLEVVVDVLSSQAVKIHKGARVFLERWGGEKPLLGEVRLVEPSGFTKISALGVEEQRVNVIIDLVDPIDRRRSLGDAYRVEARIVIWEKDEVLLIPAGALFRDRKEWAAFVVRAGQAQLQHVTVGHRNGLDAQVLDGLQENDRVVVHPSDKVKNGVAVVPRSSLTR